MRARILCGMCARPMGLTEKDDYQFPVTHGLCSSCEEKQRRYVIREGERRRLGERDPKALQEQESGAWRREDRPGA